MYGKAMSIPDELMMRYFMLVTDMPIEEQEDMENVLKVVNYIHVMQNAIGSHHRSFVPW